MSMCGRMLINGTELECRCPNHEWSDFNIPTHLQLINASNLIPSLHQANHNHAWNGSRNNGSNGANWFRGEGTDTKKVTFTSEHLSGSVRLGHELIVLLRLSSYMWKIISQVNLSLGNNMSSRYQKVINDVKCHISSAALDKKVLSIHSLTLTCIKSVIHPFKEALYNHFHLICNGEGVYDSLIIIHAPQESINFHFYVLCCKNFARKLIFTFTSSLF